MIATGERLRKNAWGKYYVNNACNGCGICASYASCNFEGSDDGAYYYVVQQPYDDWEEQEILDAIEACPLHCIRDDGEQN